MATNTETGMKTFPLFDRWYNEGWSAGPLFNIIKRRMPKRYGTRIQGILRRGAEKKATPLWADRVQMAIMWYESRRLTTLTGVQHSVDHIVPLLHPLVCGLHWHGNLRVIPMDENLRKGNNWWPDMPNEQLDLF